MSLADAADGLLTVPLSEFFRTRLPKSAAESVLQQIQAAPEQAIPGLVAVLSERRVQAMNMLLRKAGVQEICHFWPTLLNMVCMALMDLSHLLFTPTSKNVLITRRVIRNAVRSAIAVACLRELCTSPPAPGLLPPSPRAAEDVEAHSPKREPSASTASTASAEADLPLSGRVSLGTDVPDLAQKTVELLKRQEQRCRELQQAQEVLTVRLSDQVDTQKQLLDEIKKHDKQLNLMQRALETVAESLPDRQ